MTISRSPRGKRMSCWDVCERSSANLKKIFATRLRDCRQGNWKRSFGYWLLGRSEIRGQRSDDRYRKWKTLNSERIREQAAQRRTPNSQRPTERKRKRGKLTLTAETESWLSG